MASNRPPSRSSIARPGVESPGADGHGAYGDAVEKLLPQNVEAEMAVLGALLIDPEPMAQVAEILPDPDDFYREAHRAIYRAMRDLADAGEPWDLVVLCDELMRRGHLATIGEGYEAGGTAYVAGLANRVPSSRNAAHYAHIVERTARLRRLIHAAGQIAGVAYNEPDADAAVEQAERLIAAVAERVTASGASAGGVSRGPQTLADLMAKQLPDPEWVVHTVLTEGLAVLAGGKKLGKSWLAFSLALAVAGGGMALGQLPVEQGEALYLALEDTERRLQKRAGQLLEAAGFESPPAGLHLATEWPRLDEGGLARLDRWLDGHPACRLVVVDTWAMVRPTPRPNADQYMDDYQILSSVKKVADRHHACILLVHHTRKATGVDGDWLDEVHGSGAVTGRPDTILLLKRKRTENLGTLGITGRDVDETEMALTFDETGGQWTYAGPADQVKRSREREDVRQVLEADGPDDGSGMSAADVAAALGKRYDAARQLLWQMTKAGEIERVGRGRYRLPRVTEPETGAGDWRGNRSA